MSRPVVLTLGACCLAVAGCAGSTRPQPTPVPLPAYSDTVLLPLHSSTHVNGFGTVTYLGSGATSCSFQWATQHPFGWSGTAVAMTGRAVTLHAFRDAELTLTGVSAEGCTFAEFLPAQPENTASPSPGS